MLCLIQLVCAALGAGLCRVTVIEDSSGAAGIAFESDSSRREEHRELLVG